MKKILLLGSGELGKEFVIAAKRKGVYVVACDKYDNILFDLDGVITSEQNYWTIAALTVWEWIYDGDKISIDYMSENAIAIREMVMCSDRMIGLLKNKGVKGIMLSVSADNNQGNAFYNKYGFAFIENSPFGNAYGIKLG